jgi:biofilm protein TabA
MEMILDVLDNANRYLTLNNGFEKALAFLGRPGLEELSAGKHEVDGDRVYAIVYGGPGRRKEEGLLEAHEKYIDIHFILAGTEDMGWKPRLLCGQPSGEYDQESDEQSFRDLPDAWITVKTGSYAIFFPEDAHMPLISSGHLHKVIVKVTAAQA